MKTEKHRSYYAVLGVEPNASQEQIKKEYRLKISMIHPDFFSGSKEKLDMANRWVCSLNEAWEILGNPKSRAEYDKSSRQTKEHWRPAYQPPPPQPPPPPPPPPRPPPRPPEPDFSNTTDFTWRRRVDCEDLVEFYVIDAMRSFDSVMKGLFIPRLGEINSLDLFFRNCKLFRDSIVKCLEKSKSIKLSKCPEEFAGAYFEYLDKWKFFADAIGEFQGRNISRTIPSPELDVKAVSILIVTEYLHLILWHYQQIRCSRNEIQIAAMQYEIKV